jgi:hypothetical protein
MEIVDDLVAGAGAAQAEPEGLTSGVEGRHRDRDPEHPDRDDHR